MFTLDTRSRNADHGHVEAIYLGGNDHDPLAVPGVAPKTESEPGPTSLTLEVDGEMFAVCSDNYGGTHYTWLSGPNTGYGFGSSPTPESLEVHRDSIRAFLNMIDPNTGYIEEESEQGFIYVSPGPGG